MNNRHYRLIVILLTAVVSVFFISCGIPTICELTGITISGSNNSFTIKGSDTDLSLVEQGPGVLICYVVGDSSTPLSELINSNGLIKSFGEISSNKIYINQDNSIMTYEAGDSNEYVLYAFNNGNENVSTPSYNIDLKKNGNIFGDSIVNASFSLSVNSWNDDLIIDVLNSNKESVQTLKTNIGQISGDYVYIYVAFSAEVGNFSNNYWSQLKYIGMISRY